MTYRLTSLSVHYEDIDPYTFAQPPDQYILTIKLQDEQKNKRSAKIAIPKNVELTDLAVYFHKIAKALENTKHEIEANGKTQ